MITNHDQAPSLRNYLIRGAFGSLFLILSQRFFGFILAVLLARVLGVKGFGTYAFCLSIVNILTIPAMMGGQQLLIREVSAYRAKHEFNFLRGLLQRMKQISLSVSILLSLSVAGIGYLVFQESPLLNVFILAMILVPLLASMNLQNAALRGLHRILLGQANLTFNPLLFIVLIGSLVLLFDVSVTPEAAVILNALSAGTMVLGTGFLLRKFLPNEVQKVKPAYEMNRWVKSMLPLLLTGIMQTINYEASVLLLGIMEDTESVGLYRVAQRGADLIPFGLMAVNMAIAPTIAELYVKGEMGRLQNIITKSVLLITSFAFPIALVFILFGNRLVPFIFGHEYTQAYIPLVFLCLGQLVNVLFGSVGLILVMIGMERIVTLGVTIAALINLLLNIFLINLWGATGAAVASASSLVIWNVLLAGWLYRKTGLVSFLKLKF